MYNVFVLSMAEECDAKFFAIGIYVGYMAGPWRIATNFGQHQVKRAFEYLGELVGMPRLLSLQ